MFRKLFVVFAALAIAVIATACASATPAPQVQTVVVEKVITPTPGAAAPKAGSVAITGAGATFPNPLYSRWFYDYAFVDTSARSIINRLVRAAALARSPARRLT